jgi:hypothetical protein
MEKLIAELDRLVKAGKYKEAQNFLKTHENMLVHTRADLSNLGNDLMEYAKGIGEMNGAVNTAVRYGQLTENYHMGQQLVNDSLKKIRAHLNKLKMDELFLEK